jgi:hypothetical protein
MLRELQEQFAAGLLRKAPAVLGRIAPGRFAPDRLLQVYRNNIAESLTGALAAVYPVIRRLVGEGFFGFAADTYMRRSPPRSGNLHDFGDDFDAFLAGFDPARELPYLPDVARLEWAWHRAFHAADGAPLPLDRLATVPPEHHGALRFRLHPSARLLASDHPVLHIWQANQHDSDDVPPVNLAEGGVRLLVWRRDLTVAIEALGRGDYALLESFAAGRPLAAAADAALHAEPELDLAAALQHQVARGVVVDFTTS